MAEASAATTILFPLPTFFANIQLSDVGWAWRRHLSTLLYTVCPSCSCIGVSKDASAMPGPATSVALCMWSQVPLPFPRGFTTLGNEKCLVVAALLLPLPAGNASAKQKSYAHP